VLAYSGGLDTTVIVPWLKEHYPGCQVIAVCIDVGQGQETDGLAEKAKSIGADGFFLEDIRDEFVTQYCWPALQAHAVYEDQYLLGTALARPPIAKRIVEVALREGADAVCHGATGKGNDQVRFELSVKALAPQLEIITPWRLWDLRSREDLIGYLEERNINLPVRKSDSYSRDRNLWHLSHEGLELEDPAQPPQYHRLLQICTAPDKAPDVAETVTIRFEQGTPVSVDGKAMGPIQILETLNAIGAKHGVGIIDIVENRVVGMKSRGVYETPGGTILYAAHQMLEQLCLDKQTAAFKRQVAHQFADLIYGGQWFTPLREALGAFIRHTQKVVTGEATVSLFKGSVTPAGVSSPYSLYNESLASFTTGELYDHKDADGFIKLIGLPIRVRAMMGYVAADVMPAPPLPIPESPYALG
jgi:argininosuccinate synthase